MREKIKIFLRFIILFGLHYMWLRLYIVLVVATEFGDETSNIKNFAISYFKTWWAIPATAVIVNLINYLFAKLIPIGTKWITRLYWGLSVIMTLILFAPFIIYIWSNLIVGM